MKAHSLDEQRLISNPGVDGGVGKQQHIQRLPTDEAILNHDRLSKIVNSHNNKRGAIKRLVLSSSDGEDFLQRKSQGAVVSEEFFDENNISANNISEEQQPQPVYDMDMRFNAFNNQGPLEPGTVIDLNRVAMHYLSREMYRECFKLLKQAENVLDSDVFKAMMSNADPAKRERMESLTLNNIGCYYKK